jgi:phosphoribosylanthranilate isomerase
MTALVKICGVTNPEDAAMAVEEGAAALGFVLWPGSSRKVSTEEAAAIARGLPGGVLKVGVFVDSPREGLRRAAEECPLDVLQLHGSETPDAVAGLGPRVWKAVRVGPGFSADEALRFEGRVDGILLDTRAEVPGGSGTSFDWDLAGEVRRGASFLILAGGLTPENVGEAIDKVKPDMVDVSTGVEARPGRKDPGKVRAFMEAVRSRA